MRWCARCSACSSRRRHLLEWVTAAQTTEEFRIRPARPVAQIAASAGLRGCCRRPILFFGSAKLADRRAVCRSCGCCRRSSRDGRACRRRWTATLSITPSRRTGACGSSRGAHGASSKNSSPRKTTCCRPTIFRRTRNPSSPTAPRRPISACISFVVAARDFGWLGMLDVLDRLEATFATMEKLERFRGHFYNWYDTSDLRALEPKYVSSVDSGNLAGHLIALGNACHEIAAGPICDPHWIAGTQRHPRPAARSRASADRGAPRAGYCTGKPG